MIRKTRGACSQRGCAHAWIHFESRGRGNSGSHAGTRQLLSHMAGRQLGRIKGWAVWMESHFCWHLDHSSLHVLFAMDLVIAVKLRMHENLFTVVAFIPVHLVRLLWFISLLPHLFRVLFGRIFFSIIRFNKHELSADTLRIYLSYQHCFSHHAGGRNWQVKD